MLPSSRSITRCKAVWAAAAVLPLALAGTVNAQAVRFTAPSNTIRVLGDTVLGDYYTIEAMVMRESSDGSNRLFSEQFNPQEDKALSIHDTGFGANVRSNGCTPTGVTIDGPLAANAWRHIAFVRNGSTLTYYVNGQVAAAVTTSCPTVNAAGGNMSFGAFPHTASTTVSSSFIGRVDWFRVSNTARYTAAFQGPVCEPDSDADTVMLFKFNDAPGTSSPVDSGPSHFVTAVAAGFLGATAPTFGFAGAPASGGTAVLNQTFGVVCHGTGAQFSVAAPAGATNHQWQLETAPGQWLTLGNDPTPLPCGGNASFAYATPVNSAAVTIGLHGCPGPLNVRCLVTTPCGVVTSSTARLLVNPADIGSQGGVPGSDGQYDNNDFVVFIDDFFTSNPNADVGTQGGVLGSDGQFNNNDFVSFIDLFFTGC